MKAGNRLRAAVAAAVTGALVLTGCSQLGTAGETGTPAPKTAPQSAELPAAVPDTFAGNAEWMVDQVVPGSVRISRHGVVALFGPADHRRVALIDARTGRPTWSSVAFATGEEASLQVVQHDGREWAVVWFATSETTLKLVTFDLHGTGIGQGKGSAHSERFTGKKLPAIRVTSRGILISGVSKAAPFMLWPSDGARTSYGVGPTADGEAGVPWAAYNNGFLVAFPNGGFSFAGPTGGWPSSSAVPAGGLPNTGRMLDVTRGLILASWDQSIGGTVLAVHSAQTGRVLAQQVVSDEQPLSEVDGSFVVADDTSWAAFGGYLFNLHGDTLSTGWRDLHDGVPVSIYQGVLYLRDVAEPFAPPTSAPPTSAPSTSAPSTGSPSGSPTPSGSSTPSGSASPSGSPSAPGTPAAPANFSGWAAVDAETGVLVDQSMQTVPIGVSSVAAGVFTAATGRGGSEQLFSVRLR